MKKRRVVVLGATGSIGQSAAKVARDIPDRMEIVGMSANRQAAGLAGCANELRPLAVCLTEEKSLPDLQAKLDYHPAIFSSEDGLVELAKMREADLVLIAIVGTGGLRPALAAI